MESSISGKKVLILVSNGVDEAVMSNVQREMLKTGAVIKTVGIEPGLVNSWNNNNWGLYFPVDQQISQTLGSDFDALIVPSGARSMMKLSGNAHSDRIINHFIAAGKPMVFMGDAVELLAKLDLAKGWMVSGPERSHQVMTAAGATWSGDAVCVHNALMTGACEDVTAFISAMLSHISGTGMAEEDMKAAA